MDIQSEFTKRINEKIAIREHSTRPDKERVFGEMMIYEDAIRIMNQVIAYIHNVESGKITVR